MYSCDAERRKPFAKATMKQSIKLSSTEPFAQGGNRLCFVDPRDPERCVKVARQGRSATEKRLSAPGWKRFRPLRYYDDNLRELDTCRRIERFLSAEVWTRVPQCYGMVDTDLGEGIVTDLVRNADGSIARDLKAKLRKEGNDRYFRAAVDDLLAFLRRTGLPTRDLLLHNLVARDHNEKGHFTIYIIDGFGSADALPLAYWSRYLGRKKVERKIPKFLAKVDEFCRKYSIPKLS